MSRPPPTRGIAGGHDLPADATVLEDSPADLPLLVAIGAFDPRDPEEGPGLHALVRRFRSGDPDAARQVLSAARTAVRAGTDLRTRSVLVVPVPGHDPATPSPAIRAIAAQLADEFGWLLAAPPSLVRIAAIPEAKRRGSRDDAAEVSSLAWRGGSAADRFDTILLVDDVVASGRTIRACIAAIRRAGGREEVRALVIAQAMKPR